MSLSVPVIKLENVSYSYPRSGKWALKNITLDVAQSELLAVMGENSAGKSTFCKLINGIIPHSQGGQLRGSVTVDGIITANSTVPDLARKAGMVLDDPDIQLFTDSVLHEAAFGPENLLLPPEEIEQRVKRALAAVGLEGYEERSPMTLSGGEKQRLAIAAALAMEGKILVMDEPVCGLDPAGAAGFFSVLKSIREKHRLTVIMATHDSEKALEFADRVCILKDGAVAACDTTQRIFCNSDLLRENGIRPPAACALDGFMAGKVAELPVFTKDVSITEEQRPTIRIVNLSHSYDSINNSLEDVNVSIAQNDFVAIIGQNGCGKSTLLKNICGLLRPSRGEIFIRGNNLKDLPLSAISAEIGFVMQNPDTQLFTDTVYSEVSFALRNAGMPEAEIRHRVDAALSAVGLEEQRDAFPLALNRGDRRKTVIAAVLAMGSRIIVLDEPDAGLDYRGSRRIMDIAGDLNSQGYTIIFVSHNMPLVEEYARRLIVMSGKSIIMDKSRGI